MKVKVILVSTRGHRVIKVGDLAEAMARAGDMFAELGSRERVEAWYHRHGSQPTQVGTVSAGPAGPVARVLLGADAMRVKLGGES